MTLLKEARRDTLPEGIHYRDDGCEYSPRCLICPLPICKFDDAGWIARDSRAIRNDGIIAMSIDGGGVVAIALAFEVSTRTVFRVIKERMHPIRGAPRWAATGSRKAASNGVS